MKRIIVQGGFIALAWVLNTPYTSFAQSGGDSLALSPTTNIAVTNEDFLTKVESLIQQGRQQGLDYLSTKDNKTKRVAKQTLEEAETLLKKKLKQESDCERCYEFLVNTHFYQGYFGFSKNYDDCIKKAAEGIEKFPSNSRLYFLKGYAHYNMGEYSECIKAFNHFLMTPATDTQSVSQVRQLLQDGQQKFLAGWNQHSQYYQSPESRITVYNQQTYKNETAFQVTPDWEMNLGSQGFITMTAQATKLDDAEIKEYLDNLVSRLINKSPGSPFSYQITIVNSPEVNAFTSPGHIVIYTGLLAAAENESELAGVLSHELAHNYAHHQARAVLQKFYMQSAANSLAKIINPQTAATQIAAQLASSITVDLFARVYSRNEEKEADLYGCHILFNAGYNPTAASNFFLKLYKLNPKRQIKLLSTHPPTVDRATYLTEYLESFPLDKEMQLDSKEFQKMKTKLATLIPGIQPKDPNRGALPKQ